MNYKIIGRYLGNLLTMESAILLIPALISLFLRETIAFTAICITIILAFTIGTILRLICRSFERTFYAKEGLLLVALSWIILSLFGALPFTISGEIPSYVDSFFEIVSGFTTTGASILTDPESMSYGLMFWRCFTHWLGGMGILVFLMALEPRTKGNSFSLHVMRAESPGPSVEKLVPRISQTAKILYSLYIGLSIICFIFLLAGGMSVFDALCTTFGTAGTGGFGIKNDSMASYSTYLQIVVTVFMALFGVNFSVYYLLIKKPKDAVKDEEVRAYFLIMLAAIALITINLSSNGETLLHNIHHASFHVSSVMTTTGFAISDFNLWPPFSKGILLLLMVFGACAGSTGGGTKIARWLLISKSMKSGVKQMLHPRSVSVVKINGKPVDQSTLHNVNVYFTAYVVILIVSFLTVSLDGFSIETNLSAVLSCFNNIGPGLDLVGPAGNYSSLSALSKLVLSLDMLLGRLEIFPLLALLNPELLRKKNIIKTVNDRRSVT